MLRIRVAAGVLALAAALALGMVVVRPSDAGRVVPSHQNDPEVARLLAALPETQSIRIDDSWMGLSPVAPLNASYALERQGAQFVGLGEFGARGMVFGSIQSGPRRTATRDIVLPPADAETFLRMLTGIQAVERPYDPQLRITDHYPSLSIRLETPDGTLTVFSQAQGTDRVPWALRLGERTFVVDSDLPTRAFATLEPYLHRDVLQSLADEVLRARRDAGNTPVPRAPVDPASTRPPVPTRPIP
jgi:hypothetical protein